MTRLLCKQRFGIEWHSVFIIVTSLTIVLIYGTLKQLVIKNDLYYDYAQVVKCEK